MSEWETPPTFAAGITSASKLKTLSRLTDFLQGRVDGPKAVFGGFYLENVEATWTTEWTGWIRHQELTLRYVVWVKGEDGGDAGKHVYMRIQYDGTTVDSEEDLGSQTNFTKKTSTLTINRGGLGISVGDWVQVTVDLEKDAGVTNEGIVVAMIREEKTIERAWVLAFNSGSTVFTAGETLTGATGGATGTVTSWYLTGGAWATNDAAGVVRMTGSIGVWQAEDLNGSTGGNNMASSTGAGVAVETFSATETDLTGKLDHLSANLTAFKTVADMPDGPAAGLDFTLPGSYDDIKWDDDEEERWGGGFQFPGTGATLVYAFEAVDGAGLLKVYCTEQDGAWADPGDVVDTITLTQDTIIEGTIDISGIGASEGDWCRLKLEGDKTSGDPTFRMWIFSIRNDTSPTPVEYWRHGRGLDHADLNTLGTRISGLNPDAADPDGKASLSQWWNQATKEVGVNGFRIHILRRIGWRYLHYKVPTGVPHPDYQPVINYIAPGGTTWESYALESQTAGWTTLDLEALRVLTPGVYYNVDDVDCAAEWDST